MDAVDVLDVDDDRDATAVQDSVEDQPEMVPDRDDRLGDELLDSHRIIGHRETADLVPSDHGAAACVRHAPGSVELIETKVVGDNVTAEVLAVIG